MSAKMTEREKWERDVWVIGDALQAAALERHYHIPSHDKTWKGELALRRIEKRLKKLQP